ncbi:ASCH domain-containing protein [bacterium]|nr:MAG: ASCH domain-containing protein [bacterium]
MKALSIRHPWSWAILYANKRIENRTWPTRFRGEVFIHAGKTIERDSVEMLRADSFSVPEELACGAIVGVARLVDCIDDETAETRYPDQVEWISGPWCFILEEVRALATPIPCHGKLGFFDVPADVAATAGAALALTATPRRRSATPAPAGAVTTALAPAPQADRAALTYQEQLPFRFGESSRG